MIQFFKSLLSESNQVSCLRFMALSSLFLGAGIAYLALLKNVNLSQAAPVVAIFVGSAFGGKVAQKYAEKKNKVSLK